MSIAAALTAFRPRRRAGAHRAAEGAGPAARSSSAARSEPAAMSGEAAMPGEAAMSGLVAMSEPAAVAALDPPAVTPAPQVRARRWPAGTIRRPDPLGVAAVTSLAALAAFVRLWRLDAVGFRGDEAVYAGQAELLAHTGGMDRWFILASRGNSNFLVYQWIVAVVYRIFGVSDTAARVVSAAFSVLTVLLVYLIGQLLYGRASGFLAGLLLAVSGYAIGLGRLALLDSTVTFFITAAMFCLLKWHLTGRTRWLAGLGIMTAIASQAKVTSVLLVPIALGFLVLSGDWRRLRVRTVGGAALLSVPALTPFALQVMGNHAQLAAFLSASTKRASDVAWYFYLSQLWHAEGLLMCAVLGLGVLLTVLRHDPRDLLPVTWLATFVLFLQLYPLKGFNYLLPAIPALVLLTGRSLRELLAWSGRAGRLLPGARPVLLATAAAAVAICLTQAPSVRAAMTDQDSAGMREAAYWLRAQGVQRAGTMTLSHGSGQYVLSFYGGIDSYPYGKFRIATVLPGGQVVSSTAPRNQVPLDWVDVWPARLIQEGRVSYLVYSTRALDDPPEQDQVSGTVTQQRFRSLIQDFGGRLVHVVYWQHEARVYIFRVSKRAMKPALRTEIVGRRVVLTATGLVADSPVTVSYHGGTVARGQTDDQGTASISLPVPDPGQPQYHVVVTDSEGTTVSATGLPSSKLVYVVRGDLVEVAGSRFAPGSSIRLTYGLTGIGQTAARPDGSFRWSFRLPRTTHTRYRIRASDDAGHVAWAIGLQPPSLAFVETANRATVTGEHYLPDATVTLTYHGRPVAVAHTDSGGAFRAAFDVPPGSVPAYQLVAVDPIGRRAGVVGLMYRR